MSEPLATAIVTDGDAYVNILNALGDLSQVSNRISSTINHLSDFVVDNVEVSPQQRIILKQINLLQKASEYMTGKVHCIIEQSKMSSVINRVESRKRAASNYIQKMDTKKKKKPRNNYIHLDDNILNEFIKSDIQNNKQNKIIIPPRAYAPRKTRVTKPDYIFDDKNKDIILKPINGLTFTLKEAFLIMSENSFTPNQFYKECTDDVKHNNKPLLSCSIITLYSARTYPSQPQANRH